MKGGVLRHKKGRGQVGQSEVRRCGVAGGENNYEHGLRSTDGCPPRYLPMTYLRYSSSVSPLELPGICPQLPTKPLRIKPMQGYIHKHAR